MGRKKRKAVEQTPPTVGGVVVPVMPPAMTAFNVKTEMPSSAVVAADRAVLGPRAGATATLPLSTTRVVDPRRKGISPPPTQVASPAASSKKYLGGAPSIRVKSATMSPAAGAEPPEDYLGSAKPSSQYGLHSHSGDLVEDDVYVSDGSLDSDEDEEGEGEEGDGENKNKEGAVRKGVELVITTSKMGLMRRGGVSSLLGAPSQVNRTWVRKDEGGEGDDVAKEDQSGRGGGSKEEVEDEANLDPAQRLALQQRRIERAKAEARLVESSENAGRDPCLFSKRTAFDIRMDQIDEKPWEKGEADMTDFFNYGMMEEDWLEYSEGQLAVRQELTDASKQKRLPDPGIVPVVPRAPKVQGDRVAVRAKKMSEGGKDDEGDQVTAKGGDDDEDDDGGLEMGVELGPLSKPPKKENAGRKRPAGNSEGAKGSSPSKNSNILGKVIGGAWGAGAAKDSVLIRLIQEQSGGGPGGMHGGNGPPPNHPMAGPPPMMGMPPPSMMAHPVPPPPGGGMMRGPPPPQGPHGDGGGQWRRDRHPDFRRQGGGGGGVGSGGGHPQQQPPPPSQHHLQQPPPRHSGGRGGYPGHQQQHSGGGRGGGGGYPPRQGQFHQRDQPREHQREPPREPQRGPPPGQYHHRGGGGGSGRGGGGRGEYRGQGPPPPSQGHRQHWAGGGGRGGGGGGGGGRGAHGERGGRGYFDHRACGGPPPSGGRSGPPSNGNGPPHGGGGGGWDSRKRPRDGYGGSDPRGDPRADQRRGRW